MFPFRRSPQCGKCILFLITSARRYVADVLWGLVAAALTDRGRRVLLGIVWSLIPLFLATKIAEAYLEHIADGTPISWSSARIEGIARRLQNPSFWAIPSCAIAILLVIRAARYAGIDNLRENLSALEHRLRRIGFRVLIIALVSYLAVVFIKRETFFYHWSVGWPQHARSPLLVGIQVLEGIGVIGLILITTLWFPIGVACAATIRVQLRIARRRGMLWREPDLLYSSSCLASAGVLPVSIGCVAQLAYRIVTLTTGLAANWTHPWPVFWTGLIAMVCVGWPFLLLTADVLPYLEVPGVSRTVFNFMYVPDAVAWLVLILVGERDLGTPWWIEKSEFRNRALRIGGQVAWALLPFTLLATWISIRRIEPTSIAIGRRPLRRAA
jgi:hypothetical protein